MEQHQPGGRHVERKAEEGRDQKDRREHREVQRLLDVHRHEEDDHRGGDVGADEHVEHDARHRHHEHHHYGDDCGGNAY